MGKDFKYGFRMLAKSPAFTLLAVTALALGIGANTAIFSVVNAVLIQKLPYKDPDRLVMVWEQSPRTGKPNVANPINFLEWQGRNHSFERIAAMIAFPKSLTGDGEPEQLEAMSVTEGFFPILGVQPIRGRWFTPEEDTPGKDNVAILSEGLWRRRYAADENILGRKIKVNNQDVTVVGVMPAGFRFPFSKPELWSPMAIDRVRAGRNGRYLITVARLRPGSTVATAQADMNTLQPQLIAERPQFNSKWGITVVSLSQQVAGDVKTPLVVLLAAVGLVLLIACANVANLMLMRAANRSREVAIRSALGASGWRVARQLLVESTLLSVIGGALGLALGVWVMKLLVAALPASISNVSLETIRIDATVFVFAAALSILTGMFFGLAPALKAVRIDVQEGLKSGGRGYAGGRSVMRNVLVVAEVALSMVLLVGAGLLIRSFAKLSGVDPGFDAPHVLSMQLATQGRYREDGAFFNFLNRTLERVRSVPGVEAAGTAHFLPLDGLGSATGFWRNDHPKPDAGAESITQVTVVMPGYFASLRIPLIRGRVFDERDRKDAPPVLVINQALARQFYPNGEDPVGKRLNVQWTHTGTPYEIVGVVGDVHQTGMDKDPAPGVFIANLQEPNGPVNLVLRAQGDPKMLSQTIQREIHAIDPDLPIANVQTMDSFISASVAAPRFNTILLGGFAALALLLAAVGIFGVISYSVTQRTQELGVRRALGADTWSVMRLVLVQGIGLTILGLAIGVAGALAVTRLMKSLLFDVTSTDAITYLAVSAVLLLVAFAACYLPARRAAQVDPMVALRYE
jgi:putative ABC transport system permease protein